MQIDWLTVGAQAVNFLVLVWLLQRFLYGPVTRAMARREQRIRERLDEAAAARREAEDQARDYRRMERELEEQRAQVLEDARQAAAEDRRTLERVARQEVETRRREWLQQLEGQRDGFLGELRRRTAEQFFVLARRALADLADADLQERIAARFVEQMENLDEKSGQALAAACHAAGDIVRVRSRFELSANARRQITRVLHGRLGPGLALEYDARDDVSCGIELKTGGRTVAWTLDNYLDDLEQAVDQQVSMVLTAAKAAGE